jgi:hypothetical protein
VWRVCAADSIWIQIRVRTANMDPDPEVIFPRLRPVNSPGTFAVRNYLYFLLVIGATVLLRRRLD